MIALVLLGVGFWIWRDQIIGLFVKQSDVVRQNPVVGEAPVNLEASLARFITPTTGEVWLKEPKKIDALGWLRQEDKSYRIEIGWSDEDYYKYYHQAIMRLARETAIRYML